MSLIFILMREVNLVKLFLQIVWLVVPSSGIVGNLSCWGLAESNQLGAKFDEGRKEPRRNHEPEGLHVVRDFSVG